MISISKTGRNLLTGALVVLWGFWLVGLFFRDATPLTGFLFYIPSALLFVLLICGGFYAFRAKQRVLGVFLLSLAVVPAFAVLRIENHLLTNQSRRTDQQTLRLVHWNVFRGHLGWDGIQKELRLSRPDVCVLSEIPDAAAISSSLIGTGWSSLRFSNMAIMARGSLEEGRWLYQREGVEAYGAVWKSPQGVCRVMVIDLASSLSLPRAPRLLIVRKLMADWHPDIVVGDFNAPRLSNGLCPLPTGFVHAYEVVGTGWSYTWPMPFPVYSIDQCIVGKRILPVAYSLESSFRSDHRRQIFDFTIGR